jgi:hypothetical protein
MSRLFRFICSLYLLWCVGLGTYHTWDMIKDYIRSVCTYVLSLL